MLADYIASVVAAAAQFAFIKTLPSAPLRLLARALLIATDELARRGEFAPFGLAISGPEEIVTVAALSCAAIPRVEQLLALLEAGLQAGRRSGRYLATAIALESEMPYVGARTFIRVFELRLCEDSRAATLFFPLAEEDGHITLEWPHSSGPTSPAQNERRCRQSA
jgi:hypothetical protein